MSDGGKGCDLIDAVAGILEVARTQANIFITQNPNCSSPHYNINHMLASHPRLVAQFEKRWPGFIQFLAPAQTLD